MENSKCQAGRSTSQNAGSWHSLFSSPANGHRPAATSGQQPAAHRPATAFSCKSVACKKSNFRIIVGKEQVNPLPEPGAC